jgi:hypothetical protein
MQCTPKPGPDDGASRGRAEERDEEEGVRGDDEQLLVVVERRSHRERARERGHAVGFNHGAVVANATRAGRGGEGPGRRESERV